MSVLYTVQPVTDFTIFTTPPEQRKPILFKSTWSQTLKELGRELEYLDADGVLFELDVQTKAIRRDGMLYADAKVNHPGVRVSFQSRHGALSYTCDTYEARYYGQMPDWQANVRAIVLTLESLRAVDRYGATKGEQYAGFKALPAGTGATALGGMTHTGAKVFLHETSGMDAGVALSEMFRMARAKAHPDRNGGDRTLWDQVELAGKVLGLA